MPIGEAFLFDFLKRQAGNLASPLITHLGKLYGLEDEVAKLQRTLKRLQAMFHDAEQRKMEGEIFTLRLRELKSVICDAEDLVDELGYEELRRKVEEELHPTDLDGANKFLLSSFEMLRKFCSLLSPQKVLFRHNMARRIDGIRKNLDEIAKDYKDLGGMLDAKVNEPECRGPTKETSSLLTVPDVVIGRDEVKNQLIKLLLRENSDGPSSSSSSIVLPTSLSVISIVGMGGLGKTTLAKWVYNNEKIQEHFHPRIWVYVSHDFNLKKITRQILEHVVDSPSRQQDIDSLNVLQESLLNALRGKRFLLILDDMWEEGWAKWSDLSASLSSGEKGSTVLITTRNVSVSKMTQSQKIPLEDLSYDDCWSIFKNHAFPDGNSEKHRMLKSIGGEIVKKLMGNPLAATTVGGLLRSNFEERKWREVLGSELWELKQGEEDILPALKLSYDYLPPHLKPCFAYCCVYLNYGSFDMLESIQLWMAHGYVQAMGKKCVEDVGRDYFNELFCRSLIQLVNGKYVIHDLLHELGREILQHDFCKIDSDQMQNIPEDAQFRPHLRIIYKESFNGEFEVPHKFEGLRTLSFGFYRSPYIQVPHNLFDTLKCLRVLDMSFSGLETLPDSIGCLKHLRYIDLRETKLRCLPDSLCALYNLQTVRLEGCDELDALPSGMSNLINLHYLEAKSELVSKIANIGKLTHLQELEVFSVSKENGNKVGDLKSMNELRDKLCVRNLQEVETKQEAIEAALKNKQYLEVLEMEWADGRHINEVDFHLEESIIEGLQPPPHLKELFVKCYLGINFPSWMNNHFDILTTLCITNCPRMNSLPDNLHSLPLQQLVISQLPELVELPLLPDTLEELIIEGVMLNSLPDNLHSLPLQKLVVREIPELVALPLLPDTLKELTVESVMFNSLPKFSQHHGLSATTLARSDEDQTSDNKQPSLTVLKIHGCPRLKTLAEGLLQYPQRNLRVLSIKDCQELEHWPNSEAFRSTLCSLKEELSIESCPKLHAFPEMCALTLSLEKLIVKDCPEVPNKSLFSQLGGLKASADVCVEKLFPDLACCSKEALRHLIAVDILEIRYIQEEVEDNGLVGDTSDSKGFAPAAPVSLLYNKTEDGRVLPVKNNLCRRVELVIREKARRGRRPVNVEVDDGDDNSFNVLSLCLGDHSFTSSLRELILEGIPDDREFLHIKHAASSTCASEEEEEGDVGGNDKAFLLHLPLLHFPLLETLRFWDCREMRRLPTEMLLCYTKALKRLAFDDCPELTLSSVEEGIRSIPSLEQLYILRCPLLGSGGSQEDGALSGPAPPFPPPPALPLLQHLTIDDAGLLRRLPVNDSHCGQNTCNDDDNTGRFFRDHLLTSLRVLRIKFSKLTCLTAEEEEGLRSLGSSLHCLMIRDCPNLWNLPKDLRGLLPNLKVLSIDDCPEIRCLPDEGLPASLEFLRITGCSTLGERCRPRPDATPRAEDDDLQKMAPIPVIQIDDRFLRGSYSKFLELKARWDFDVFR